MLRWYFQNAHHSHHNCAVGTVTGDVPSNTTSVDSESGRGWCRASPWWATPAIDTARQWYEHNLAVVGVRCASFDTHDDDTDGKM